MMFNSIKFLVILCGFVLSHSIEDRTGNSNSRSRLSSSQLQGSNPVFLAASQPVPSGSPRAFKRAIDPNSEAARCPSPQVSCPISSSNQSDTAKSSWECVNTNEELTSCGRCNNNCLKIENVANVGCAKGTCKIFSCKAGYNVLEKIDENSRVVEVCAQPRPPF